MIADATGFPSGDPVGAIFAGADGGAGFSQIGQVADPVAEATGLCCTTIFEVPQQVGGLAAGTLPWAGAVGQAVAPSPRMTIRVWQSTDQGRTWGYLSTNRHVDGRRRVVGAGPVRAAALAAVRAPAGQDPRVLRTSRSRAPGRAGTPRTSPSPPPPRCPPGSSA